MSHLEAPAASLFYDTIGQGPVLLCISGANGNAEIWRGLAELLEEDFTVVIYDRRGFSRSYLSAYEAQDYSQRLETDADDAALLIKHVTQEPAFVLGSSSGAIVALKLLERHPDLVRTVIPHEPPAMRLLPDYNDLRISIDDIYDTYRKFGMPPALKKFGELVNLPPHELGGLMEAFNPRNDPHAFSNAQYWFEREFESHPMHPFDIGAFRPLKEKLLLANSEDGDPSALHYRPNLVIAEKLGSDVVYFPGGHLGYATHAPAFAQKLLDVLKVRS